VVVVGDLLLDLVAEVREPLARGTDTGANIGARAGGSSASVAVRLAGLGVETHFVGRVGRDVIGRFLAEDLERRGVTHHLAEDPSLETGKVVVLVEADGERTMITDRGASGNLRPQDLPQDLFGAGRHLHLAGYGFSSEGSRDANFEALRRACQAGMTVSVDPSSVAALEAIEPARFLEWTEGADILFPNLEEGALLADSRDPDAIVGTLRERYPDVVLKLGPQGAVHASGDGEPLRLPAAPTEVADTTGAGDALCAGFLAAWLSGDAPAAALQRGLDLAARCVGEIGGR